VRCIGRQSKTSAVLGDSEKSRQTESERVVCENPLIIYSMTQRHKQKDFLPQYHKDAKEK
jgi:hypothetical protein